MKNVRYEIMKYKISIKEYSLMFELSEVQEKDKDIIFNLMQLYTYELSFFEDETTNCFYYHYN